MRRTKPVAAPMVARVYLRVSTDAQDLERQRRSLRPRRPPATTSPASTVRRHPAHAPTGLSCCADRRPTARRGGHCREIDRISRLPCPRPSAGGLDTGQRRKPAVPAWSIYPTGGRGPGRRQDRAGSRADHAFRLALQMARDDYEDRRERQRQGIELARRPGGTRAAVLIEAPRPSCRAAQVRLQHQQDRRAGRVQCGP